MKCTKHANFPLVLDALVKRYTDLIKKEKALKNRYIEAVLNIIAETSASSAAIKDFLKTMVEIAKK